MNFLNFLTSGSSLFNFQLQNTMTAPKLQMQLISLNNKQKQAAQKNNFQHQEMSVDSSLNLISAEKMIPELLLTQHQQFINQYMHLNIQLMNQKIQALQNQNQQKSEESQQNSTLKSMKKKIKKRITCGHDEKSHYAKGMCSNCYHKYGRTKKPWNCPHEKLYASGMCQNCYINCYNKKKRQKLHSQDKDTQGNIDEDSVSLGYQVKQENHEE